jgi:hypothetical protein
MLARGATMGTQAKGTFEVTMDAHPPYDVVGGVSIGRVSITKRFAGELEGGSTVEMLGARTAVAGSAGYVAIERVTGSLAGRTGSFVLQHSGIMTRGKPELSVRVVPDSGLGDLAGIAGAMTIDIVDGKHFYTFDYTFEPSA